MLHVEYMATGAYRCASCPSTSDCVPKMTVHRSVAQVSKVQNTSCKYLSIKI